MLAVGVLWGPLAACGWSADQPAGGVAASPGQPTAAPSASAFVDQGATAPPAVAAPGPARRADAPKPPATRVTAPTRLLPTPEAVQPSPELLVGLATADAERRTGAAPGDIRLVQAEAREWPDRSLGCPRPGLGYAQAITAGFMIVLEANGQRLEYHTDHAQVVLCAP